MKYTVDTSIPITFEAASTEDTRFQPVVIDIAHVGQNLNNSVFSYEFLEKVANTLANVPIVGYITKDNYNESDFNGHEEKLVVDGNNMDFIYEGRPYGLIPESNNYRFEDKVCDDGVTRTFLRCDGLMWRKFKEGTDILDRDTSKSQSLEFEPNSIKGYFSKDKKFHFTDAKFEAACILGNGVKPAHIGSTIEKFSISNFQEQFSEMFSELKTYFESRHTENTDSQEGGKEVDQVLEMLQKYNLTLENLQEKEIDHTQFSLEELESKVKEMFSASQKEGSDVPSKFSLTADQLKCEIRRELCDIETITEEYWGEIYSYPRYYYQDHKPDQNIVIAMDEKNWYLVGFSYSVTGDSVEIDASTLERYKVDYLPMDLSSDPEGDEIPVPSAMSVSKYEFILAAKEKSLNSQFESEKQAIQEQLNNLQSNFSKLEQEKLELETKFSAKVAQEREDAENELFDRFSEKLTDEEIADVKAVKDKFSLEEIEEKLMLAFARKNLKFSSNKQDKPLRIEIPVEETKRKSNKPYADMFE